MQLHDKVENFSLQNQDEQTVQLTDFAGKPVVLFFYPKADTPGCTIEACGFRDTFTELENAGAVVLGISRDTPKAQKKFQEKYNLSYPLLADVDGEVCRQFDVLREKNMYGKKVIGIERTTFLIGPDQRLLKIFPKVRPEGHAKEVLEAIREYSRAKHHA
jgi:thioredoxin-dependent peroxiredoxin